MKNFCDSRGRQWSISITLGAALKVKETLGVDLLQPELGDPPLIDRIGTDEILLGQIICALLESQFVAQKITAEEVIDSFDGTALLGASDAFYAELIDFFRRRGRSDRAAALEKQQALIKAGIKVMETRLQRIDDSRRIKALEKQADTILGDYYGDSEENLESTSAPLPSDK